MNDYFKYISIILSAIILAGAIIYLAISLPKYPERYNLTGSLELDQNENNNFQEDSSDYLTLYDVGAYLNLNEEAVKGLVESGELNGTFLHVEEGYIFSRSKLKARINQMINTQ